MQRKAEDDERETEEWLMDSIDVRFWLWKGIESAFDKHTHTHTHINNQWGNEDKFEREKSSNKYICYTKTNWTGEHALKKEWERDMKSGTMWQQWRRTGTNTTSVCGQVKISLPLATELEMGWTDGWMNGTNE